MDLVEARRRSRSGLFARLRFYPSDVATARVNNMTIVGSRYFGIDDIIWSKDE